MARPKGPHPTPDTPWWASDPSQAAPPGGPPVAGHPSSGSPKRRSGPIVLLLLLLVGLGIGVAALRQPSPVEPPQAAVPSLRPTAPAPTIAPSVAATPPPAVTSAPAQAAPTQPTAGALPPGAEPAVVLRIVDGDTLDTDLGRVRVFGINTPEVGAAFADEATERTASLLPIGEGIYLWRSPGSDDVDPYRRLVRTVITADGVDLGAALVREGLATAYRSFSSAYVPQELEARQAGRGMWAGS